MNLRSKAMKEEDVTEERSLRIYTEENKQEEYRDADWLHDTEWHWVRWKAPHPGWDHDHCVFCNAHICDKLEHADALRECWRWDDPEEADSYESVCHSCFSQLQEIFHWNIAKGSAQPSTDVFHYPTP